MAPSHFASFLAATGHRVVRTPGAWWYDAGPGFFLSLPSHRLLTPAPDELRTLFRRQPCFGVRFPAPLDGPGRPSYQIVCAGSDYGLTRLSANVRSKVRRGLKRCEVTAVPFDRIAAEGRRADHDTLARQGRPIRLRGRHWDRYWRAAAATPGMEGWVAWQAGTMASFLVSVQMDDCVEFLLARSRTDCLDGYPNNALIFRVAEEMLGRRGVRQITFGLESLESVTALDEFKYGMGFARLPIRQRVLFHPVVSALVDRPRVRAWVARRAGRSGRAAAVWRKMDGLLRFAKESQS